MGGMIQRKVRTADGGRVEVIYKQRIHGNGIACQTSISLGKSWFIDVRRPNPKLFILT
jgi:hypothetical protein